MTSILCCSETIFQGSEGIGGVALRAIRFNSILLCTIDEAMRRILGNIAMQTIYDYLEHSECLKHEDIPIGLDVFSFTLEQVLGVRALMIEKVIMEEFYSQLCLENKNLEVTFEDAGHFSFVNYICAMRKKTCTEENGLALGIELEREADEHSSIYI